MWEELILRERIRRVESMIVATTASPALRLSVAGSELQGMTSMLLAAPTSRDLTVDEVARQSVRRSPSLRAGDASGGHRAAADVP